MVTVESDIGEPWVERVGAAECPHFHWFGPTRGKSPTVHDLTEARATTLTKSRGGLSTHGVNKAKLHASYGDPPRDRTENLLIKSQLLCQLS